MHKSELITLDHVIDHNLLFNIPIYQRLYVWGGDQIKVLLDDLVAACAANKTVFYLGGTLVIEQGKSESQQALLDLIDGQQRFTTLWLLSIALQRLVAQRGKDETNHLAGYRHATANGQREPRIRFAIRPEVSDFFDALLEEREVADVPAASSLSHAIMEIEGYFNEHPLLCLSRLSRFIRENVQLVLTTVPAKTDLNKLFEVINNRGVQLQHHEILKARLLAHLDDRLQAEVYGQLWDACSYMGDFVEKNLRGATGLKLVPLYDNQLAAQDQEALADPEKVREVLESLCRSPEETNFKLGDILGRSVSVKVHKPVTTGEESYEADIVRSIITFPMLLQHVLRIFLARRGPGDIDRIADKDLLEIFQKHWLDSLPSSPEQEAAEVKEFIDLLWRCRYLFDKYVIKWIKDEDDEIHAIRRLRINKSGDSLSVIRESREADSAFAMLQSMLYHSQQLTTHYWLTPLLHYLLREGGQEAHLYLKYLDNYMLCSDSNETLVVRSRKFLGQVWCRDFHLRDLAATLSTHEGTGYSHYWFYKLEYILWEKYRQAKGEAWQAFRMTAKNSVEHVSPQNPEDYDSNRVSEAVLDTFGNLALVSRSINSEFGNKPYLVKRSLFRERNASKVDSLKLSLIYDKEQWNDELAHQHRAQMIADYLTYMADVDKQVNSLLTVQADSRGHDTPSKAE